ncbi:MAG: aminotransferase [Sphingobium sp.]
MNKVLHNYFATGGKEHIMFPHNDPKSEQSISVISKGDGIHVYDENGKSYVDGVSALWCNTLGFSCDRLADAAYKQLKELPFYQSSSYKTHPRLIEIAAKLLSVAPPQMDKAIFANSGSEANDTAIKLIWYYNNARNRPEKKKIIGRVNGYHGVTVATASLTGINYNHQSFDVPLDRFHHVMEPHFYKHGLPGETEEEFSTRCAKELEDLIQREGPDTFAAMWMEPVTGAGGVVNPPRTYVEKMQEVLRRYDVLLVVDEVVCGYGRVGEYWGSQAVGMTPDIMTTAKGLTSGYIPFSALLFSKEIADVINERAHEIGGFAHSLTYFGHPVGAAVALETLNIYEEMDVVNHVRKLGKAMGDGLRKHFSDHPLVGDVRCQGFLGAIELASDKAARKGFDPKRKVAQRLQTICEENGVILRAMNGDVLALCPPYIMTEDDVRAMVDTLALAVEQLSKELQDGSL